MKMALDLDDLAGKIGEFKQSTDVRTRGGVLPYITYTGMCRPTGGCAFRAEKRSEQASAHPLSQAHGELCCVLTGLVC